MNITRSAFIRGASVTALALLAGCGSKGTDGAEGSSVANSAGGAAITTSLTFSNAAWQYDANDDVYYQLGVSYCEAPADEAYEKLAVIVPAAYMKATDNGDGTFTCEVNKGAKVGSYAAETAPVVMPVNTPGYSAQSAMTEYTSQSSYTSQGIVYVHAGCRGRDHGAPAGVTDLKAAVRFLRAFADQMPGDAERVFTFGHSGGGAQSALMGATGDAPEYEAYLKAIGAVEGASDTIFGSMDWCPITNLDTADEAYEWMMGCTRGDLSEGEQSVSNALAEAFATYINSAQIPNENGSSLVLEQSSSGVYQAGTYYERVKSAIEESLNNFLADTSFPYDASSSSGMGGMGAHGGGAPSGEAPGGDAPDGGMPNGGEPSGEGPGGGAPSGEAMDDATFGQNRDAGMGDGLGDGISRNSTAGGVSISGTYDTAADYVSALNANGEWVTYNADTNTATISSVEAFCVALKQASKSLGAFDQFDRGQGENTLFGEGGQPRHFDATLAQILSQQGNEYAGDYADDLALTDSLGTDAKTRVNMYTPLFYLLSSQGGYGQGVPAKHWRIRTGINQGDTALTCELNLALAAKAHPDVESVDFATVWGQGHTQAERTGTASDNFISWIAECMA